MFERFTDRARRVVVQAQEEARTLMHDRVGPEHLLLGLLDAGGVAGKMLDALGIDPGTVRQRVEEITGRGHQAPSGRIPFTQQAKDLLALSLSEAKQLGHNYIGTEHILLALIRLADSVASRVLTELGADVTAAREHAVRILDEYVRSRGDQTG
jgi:ATP-dependent Clp protease ATP-binding subunit ClpC